MIRRVMILAAAAILVLVAFAAGIRWCWEHPVLALTIDDHPSELDALVLLGGEQDVRLQRLIEAWQQYQPKLIILSGVSNENAYLEALKTAGVPSERIVIEDRSRSTWQNAWFSREILKKYDCHDVGIVTSWYHTRRSKRTFQSLAPEMEFSALGTTADLPRDPSAIDPNMRPLVRVEYLKIAAYLVVYGIWPM